MPVRAIVFDVGETLVDETRSWREVAAHLGVPDLTLFGALGATAALQLDHREALRMVGADWAEVRAAVPHSLLPEDFYPDAIPTLEATRAAGLTVAIAGNQPASTAGALADLGVPADVVATSAGWGVAKPDPRFFVRVADAVGLPPAQIAYVGDRLDNDVLPAARAGMVSVFLRRGPWGVVHATRPEAGRADHRIESLHELLPALGIPTADEPAPAT